DSFEFGPPHEATEARWARTSDPSAAPVRAAAETWRRANTYPVHVSVVHASKRCLDFMTWRGNLPPAPWPMTSGDADLASGSACSWAAEIDTPPRPYKVSEHDVESTGDGSTAVHLGALKGETEMLDLMLRHQPQRAAIVLARRDINGQTPLHKAPSANVELRDCQEDTVLLLSARQAAVDCIRALLAHGADVSAKFAGQLNQKDTFGCTAAALRPSERATWPSQRPAEAWRRVLRVLKPGLQLARCTLQPDTADLTLVATGQGKSPLHLAAEGGATQRLSACCCSGGSVLLKHQRQTLRLHLVAKQGHIDVAKLILAVNHGIIDAKNRLERWPQSFKTPDGMLFFKLRHQVLLRARAVVAAVIQHERWKEILWNVGPNHCPIFETGQVPAGVHR
uniref:ANK_REP_REGION domain-containing protein n=1 Tax=Macrostomum lignano TaxID=282301 RepID=A0A1I8FJG6_9PLAT